jgi:hypothetical protein
MVVAAAFLPLGTLAIAPLQAEGLATGLVFVTGLLGVWVALSERAPAPARAPVDPTPLRVPGSSRTGAAVHAPHRTDPGQLRGPQEASR